MEPDLHEIYVFLVYTKKTEKRLINYILTSILPVSKFQICYSLDV